MTSEPTPLHSDKNPHVSRLCEDIDEVIDQHMARGILSNAEVIGVLVMMVMDIWSDAREI